MQIHVQVILLAVCAVISQGDAGTEMAEKAAKAHGGDANLEKLRTSKIAYTVVGDFSSLLPAAKDLGTEVAVEETYQLPNQVKKEVKAKIKGKPVKITWAVNGDSAWSHSDEDNKTVTVKEKLNVETMYRPYRLFDLLTKYRKASSWKPIGDKEFYGQQTAAVEAKCKELNYDLTLYFDKSTGLLAGTMVRKNTPDKKMLVAEVHFTNYKEMHGLKLPMKQTAFHQGKKLFDITVENVQLLDKIDPAVFAAPK
jgi:hypothetical protein